MKKGKIEEELEKKTSKLEQLLYLKQLILRGATGFKILLETEQNYQLTYIFDKVDKSILKEIGNNEIMNDDVKSLGNEIIVTLNSQIHTIEQEIEYLEYKLRQISKNDTYD
ncbi:MAG: hypothetical protein GF311_26270 [Candidatus Lokiarchaeota archaeon]|nr:hypothetical protein [Candidatus Lokiarchaeota archaeon]